MGTLKNQPVRKSYEVTSEQVISLLEEVKSISVKTRIEIPSVLEAYRILELRRKNWLYESNGDIHDEQMSGFGEIMEQMASSLLMIAEK